MNTETLRMLNVLKRNHQALQEHLEAGGQDQLLDRILQPRSVGMYSCYSTLSIVIYNLADAQNRPS